MKNTVEIIEAAANEFGAGIKVEELAKHVCRKLRAQGIEACTMNDRYPMLSDGTRYQLRKKAGRWTAKAW